MNAYVTERELECWRHTALGHTAKEIAALMSVSIKTVETFRAQMCRRIGARSVCDLARLAVAYGVITIAVTPYVEYQANKGHKRFGLPIRRDDA